MAQVEFRIVSHWRVKARIDDVYDLISKPQDFVRWWPEVYLAAEETEPGDEQGVGRTYKLHTKGLLPYTLDWQARVKAVDKPTRVAIEAQGDLEGEGRWELGQDGDWVQCDYEWTVVANKPWMRLVAPVLRPVFAANHRWAMQKGRQGLVYSGTDHVQRDPPRGSATGSLLVGPNEVRFRDNVTLHRRFHLGLGRPVHSR